MPSLFSMTLIAASRSSGVSFCGNSDSAEIGHLVQRLSALRLIRTLCCMNE